MIMKPTCMIQNALKFSLKQWYIMHDECKYQDSQTYHVRDDLRNLKQDYIISIRSYQNYDDGSWL
jgi:hypothetical protein